MAVVSSWPFNDGPGAGFDNFTVADVVGSNPGTVSSTDAWSTTTYAGSYAIGCNGSYHAEFSNEASFGPTSTRSIALCLSYNLTQASRAAAFAPDCDSGGFEVCIGASLSDGSKIGIDVGQGGVAYQPLMGRTFTNTEWYRVVCVLKNGSAELWVNGELEDTVSYDATTNAATGSSGIMSVGHETFDGIDYFPFNGIVDEVQTFDNSLDRASIISDAGGLYVPTLVDLSTSTSTISENAGTATVYATIDRTRLVDINVALSFSGTATKEADYSSSADSIVIAAGQTSGSVTVTAINDATVESSETIIVDVLSIDHADENGTQQVTITIVDDDVAASTLTIAAFCQDEEAQMNNLYQVNTNSTAITFAMRSSTSGLLVTGLTPTVRLSKNGGALAAPAGAVGEMSLGYYSIAPSTTDFNTLGPLKLLATAANCITTVKDMLVVGYSPTLGLPSIAPGLSGGLLVGNGTGTVVLTSGGSTYSVNAAGANLATATALATAQSSIDAVATTTQLAASSAALLTNVNLAIATSAAILDDTGTNGVVVAAGSKTGYGLAANGLDSISTTAPTGVASNFREMVVQTWRRFFKPTSLTSTQLKTYADDGTTPLTTQPVTNSGGTETVGNAS